MRIAGDAVGVVAAHGFKPSFGHVEPRRDTEWWGKSPLVTLGSFFSKVTRRKGETYSSRHPNNGYAHR
ncbi:hypothetical protein DYL59_30050 [Pseudomonas kairouanensis]|uniref:Uncharacterized protein n=1 Tax=Pseudomonas kairouanensis TaxID=2293832 RepID=A0A4Z0ACK0_9PSED|nr:hypothetical protein DYL59_30050 [Pseudomonas kairouanensis]